ncbi:MAG TPA: Ig-like domain-containing protein [bacterium]|jgi:hypothetical protein|nr:Ig-like domain-containing protein [bacterium]HOG38120.1 Ig-like domain-containing protein [bacterium]HQI03176.1 Ig-like domain-containing protein [bacterium]
MKKLFIPFVVLILFTVGIFNFDVVFSAVDEHFPAPNCSAGQCYCEATEYPYLDRDRGLCIGESDISLKEERNINNIKSMGLELTSIKNNYAPHFIFLSEDLRNVLIVKLSSYCDDTLSVSTSTVKTSVPRAQRDTFFRDKYVPHLGLTKAVDILGKYDSLGNSIQHLITLANTTNLYIKNSAIDMGDVSASLSSAITELGNYIDKLNSDLTDLGGVISGFDVNNFYSFQNFSDLYSEYEASFGSSLDLYLESKDEVVGIAMEAIRRVEAAYNENSSIKADPYSISVGDSSEVTVSVRDSLNNPIIGRTVTLISSGGNPIISPEFQATNDNGIAVFNVKGTQVGKISLEAKIEGEDLVIYGSYLIEVLMNQAQLRCEAENGKWTGETCICPDGLTWDERHYHCFNQKAQDGCVATGGTWIPETPTCKCPKELPIWNEAKFMCVSEDTPGNPQENCIKDGGTWNGKTCICRDAYFWDAGCKDPHCIERASNPAGACNADGGTWDSETKICKCPKELPKWDEAKFMCVNVTDQAPETNCKKDGGTWDGETCICQDAYFWDADPSNPHCIERASNPAGACNADGGKWDGETCQCPEGFIWNKEESMCIKK